MLTLENAEEYVQLRFVFLDFVSLIKKSEIYLGGGNFAAARGLQERL